jgi:hypothetical protein
MNDLFNKFDIEHNNSISGISLKRILNILNIKDFSGIESNKNYTYDDLLNFIKNKKISKQSNTIKIDKIKEFLENYYEPTTTNFIIKDTYGEKIKNDDIVDITQLVDYSIKN